jgi:glycerol transport system ATP-binding protein
VSFELRHVTKKVHGETHIDDVSLTFAHGTLNILLGPTLSGKTSLMRLMAGLDAPTEGSVVIDGKDVTGVPVRRRSVAMVYQQFINYPNLTVYENIASPLRVGGVAKAEIDKRVRETANLVKLTPLLDRRPLELSGGQQQRTALARAIVKGADLVLLDEPLANLDYKLREELRDELPKLFAGRRCTVVFATTDPMEALLLGGHTAALHEGRITQFGPTAEVYRQPVDLRTALVFSNPPINTAPVVKEGDRIVLSDGVGWTAKAGMQPLPDGRYTLGVRSHGISPVLNGAAAVRMEGRVQITELSGAESVIHFAHGGLSWISQSQGVHAIPVGETAAFYMDVGQCMYFDADGKLIAS